MSLHIYVQVHGVMFRASVLQTDQLQSAECTNLAGVEICSKSAALRTYIHFMLLVCVYGRGDHSFPLVKHVFGGRNLVA